MDYSMPGLPVHRQLPDWPRLMSIELGMPSNHLILCCPLLFLPSVFPSIRVFSIESLLCIRWPKYWSFSFSSSPFNEYSGLISFRMDFRMDSQESSPTPQFKSINFWLLSFMLQLSHPYMTTGKTIALTVRTFVGKVMSVLFNMLSRLIIAFLPRSKGLLISWLQSPSAVILQPKKIKSHCFHCFPFVCHEVMGLEALIFVFWMLSFKPAFHSPLSLSSGDSLVPLHFLP